MQKEKNVTLEWGNRCYLKPELSLDGDFRKVIQESFDMAVEEIDFGVPSPQASAEKMNEWVKEVTHNQIKDLVDPSEWSIFLRLNLFYENFGVFLF